MRYKKKGYKPNRQEEEEYICTYIHMCKGFQGLQGHGFGAHLSRRHTGCQNP